MVTMVACNMRFHPGPAKIRELLDQGVIGDLISYRLHFGSCLPNWRPYQDYRNSYSASVETGGAILDCIHESISRCGMQVPRSWFRRCTCPPNRSVLETDGLSEILIRHQLGTIGSIHLNFIERDYRRSCVCIGAKGTLEWDFHRPEVIQYGPAQNETSQTSFPWTLAAQ